jgi:hypothetical protein
MLHRFLLRRELHANSVKIAFVQVGIADDGRGDVEVKRVPRVTTSQLELHVRVGIRLVDPLRDVENVFPFAPFVGLLESVPAPAPFPGRCASAGVAASEPIAPSR